MGFHEQRFDALGNPTGIETGRTHKTDARNEVDSQVYALTDHSTAPPAAAEPLEIDYAYDPAGRMVYDGRVVYDHDALGRVVRVRRVVGELTVGDDGSYTVPAAGQTGRLIAHYRLGCQGLRTERFDRPWDGLAAQHAHLVVGGGARVQTGLEPGGDPAVHAGLPVGASGWMDGVDAAVAVGVHPLLNLTA